MPEVDFEVYQMFPSGPLVMPIGSKEYVTLLYTFTGMVYSDSTPEVESAPIFPVVPLLSSQNQSRPSGPVVMPKSFEFAAVTVLTPAPMPRCAASLATSADASSA